MEISLMVSELRRQISETEPEVDHLNKFVAEMEAKLNDARTALTQKMDRLTAMRMAVESLEILDVKAEIPSEPKPPVAQPRPEKRVFSTKPKRIVKLTATGKQIGAWSSINRCAHDLGWSNDGVKKYISNVSPEKQIKLRGFILKFEEK